MLRFRRGYGRGTRFPMHLKFQRPNPSAETSTFIRVDGVMVHLTARQPAKKFRSPISWPTAFIILALEILVGLELGWLMSH